MSGYFGSTGHIGRVKPITPRLQWGHPLARGLITAFTFHEPAGGGRSVSEIGPFTAQYALGSSSAWSNSPNGSAFYMADATLTQSYSKRYEALSRFTFVMGVYIVSATNGSMFSKNANDGINFQRFSDNIIYFRLNGVGHSVNTAANDLAVGRWTQCACWYDGTTQKIYIDGIQKASGGGGNESIPADGAPLLINSSSAATEDAIFDYFYAYNRALTVDELRWIEHDPFSMFRSANLFVAQAPSTIKFRRTLSHLGTRMGARQRLAG